METTKPYLKINKFIFPLILVIIIIGVLFFWQRSLTKTKSQATIAKDITKPTAVTQINRTFEFQIKDPKNQPITLKFTLVSAKKVNLITMNNQPVKIKPDEDILVLDLEMQNDSSYGLKVNSQDFVRLVSGDKKYAADYYNSIQDVPAISVKKDELAFIVAKSQNQFKLQIGEINKDKTEVTVNF